MYEALKQQLNRIAKLSDSEWEIIKDKFVVRTIPKKFILVRTGDIANEVYFINKGILRLFYEKAENS